MIKFKYVIPYVEDVEQYMNFYKNTFGTEIKFITPEKDDGEELVEKAIKNSATLYENIAVKRWGQKTAYIKDPDNYLVETSTEI